ncbi:MAG: acyl-CoA dehydrogenase family protein [Anaerolineae bacterium]
MIKEFPQDRQEKRKVLLEAVDSIAETLRISGAKNEELATLAPEVVSALRDSGIFRLKLMHALGGAEADPVTQMEVFERLAYHDVSSSWCSMVGSTGLAALGTFLPDGGVEKIFKDGYIPTAAISFYPAGRVVRENGGYRVNGRWRFVSGIPHAEWVSAGAIVEGSENENGIPEVIFVTFPTSEVTLYDNWQVMGLKGTGSCDFSVENYYLPQEMTYSWDLRHPKPRRGGPLYLLPPFAFVTNEHASVAAGAARRALDELIQMAKTTRGKFRASKLDERQVVHRFIGEADIKLRSARALLFDRFEALWQKVCAGQVPDGAEVAEARVLAVYVTDIAVEIVTRAFRYGGGGALYTPHILERLLRDTNGAGQHQVVSDTAYENHGKFLLGLPADPMA